MSIISSKNLLHVFDAVFTNYSISNPPHSLVYSNSDVLWGSRVELNLEMNGGSNLYRVNHVETIKLNPARDLKAIDYHSLTNSNLLTLKSSNLDFSLKSYSGTLIINVKDSQESILSYASICHQAINTWSLHLSELLHIEFLKSCGADYNTQYQLSEEDLANIRNGLEEELIVPTNNFAFIATDQVGTSSVPGFGFNIITDQKSAASLYKATRDGSGSNSSEKLLLSPSEIASLKTYSMFFYGTDRIGLGSYYRSTLKGILNDQRSQDQYKAQLFSSEAFITTKSTPFSNRMLIKGSKEYDLDLHWSISKLLTIGFLELQKNRILNITWSKTPKP